MAAKSQGTDYNSVYARVVEDTRVTDAMGGVYSGDIGYTERIVGNAGRGTTPANAYRHETSNNIPSATAATPELVLDFQPNMLDNYDVVTYHFKLFMVSTDDASTGNVLNVKSQVIIAESGVSDLTIDKVEFDAVAGLSIEAGTGTQTTVKFEIVEPSGAGLLDRMYYSSIDLGIGNWTVMPIYLQAEFRGRDPATSNSDANGAPGALGNLRWLWALKLTDIKANVTTVGTRYSFSAILYNELAQSNASFSLQHNISLKNIETFGVAIAELEDKINKDQIEKLLDNYSKPDVYKFVIDPKIAGFHINKSNEDTVRNGTFRVFDGKSANFLSGTSVDKVIDTLLAHTVEYQELVASAKTPGAEGDPIAVEKSQMKSLWRVITETRPIVFDPRRNDNALEYTIFIIMYDVGVLDVNAFQTTGVTPAIAKKRIMTYAGKSLLKKKYNYLFTGLNDQIVSMDLTFNHSFATALTRYGGIYVNHALKDYGPAAQDNANKEKAATEALRKLISLKNNATTTFKQLDNANTEYYNAIDAAKLSDDSRNANKKLIDATNPGNKLDLTAYSKNYAIDKNTAGQTASTTRRLAKQPVNHNSVPGFVSDINLTGTDTINVYNEYLKDSKGGQLRPSTYRESTHDSASGQGASSAANTGVTKLATIFSTALHSATDVNLISIKLTIKGDPFWLFPQPIQNNDSILFNSLKSPEDAIAFFKNGQSVFPESVNLYGGDNFILIRFRSPRLFDATNNDSNTSPTTDVETFSGVYKVLMVKSRFEMGKFVQDLECLLDPVINLRDISDLIEENIKKKDTPTTVQDFIPSTTYNASNAPSSEPALQARTAAGIITQTDADLERLKRTSYDTIAEAQRARLLKAIKG